MGIGVTARVRSLARVPGRPELVKLRSQILRSHNRPGRSCVAPACQRAGLYQDAVSGHAAPLDEEPLAPTPRPR